MRSGPYVSAPCAHRYALIIVRGVDAASHDVLSTAVSRPDFAHHLAVVPGLARVITMSAGPVETRSKVIAPPWPQLRGSFRVLKTVSLNRTASSGSPFSTSTRKVLTVPLPGAAWYPGTVVKVPDSARSGASGYCLAIAWL